MQSCFPDLSDWFLSHVREIFGYHLFEYFFCPFLFLFSPIIQMLVCLMLSQSSLKLSSFLFNLFSIFCSTSVISTSLFSTSLIHSSASYILLLVASNEYFISIIVFCISAGISLLGVCCKLSVFASGLLPTSSIIFTIISLVFFLEADNLQIT